MPFNTAQPLDNFGTVGIAVHDEPDPSFMDTVGAAFRQENIVASTLARAGNFMEQSDRDAIDPNYDVFKDLAGYEDQADRFVEVFNPNHAAALKSQIDMERKDRDILAASGWTGTAVSMGASIVDLPTLIPGGALVRGGNIGYSALRSALAVGAAAGVGTAVQEAGLQATQEMRTARETALNISGSVILGGLIGGAAGKFFSNEEWARVSKQLESELTDIVPNPDEVTQTIVTRMQSAGAAAVDEINLDDLGIGGPKAAELVARATAAARINPGIETLFSPSTKVRETYVGMVDNPVYTKMNMRGESLGADAENIVKMYTRGATADWVSNNKALYKQARKAGYQGKQVDFNRAIAFAARRGDIDPNGDEFITKAAQATRSKIFDPLLKEAISLKLLPEDVKVNTALTYVTRLWNRQRLIGEEARFREIASRYFGGQLDKAIIKQEEIALGNKIVSSMDVEDRFNRAFSRLNSIEERLASRTKVREGKLKTIDAEELRRFDVLRGRAPKDVVEALRSGRERDSLVDLVKEARRAENVKMAKTPVLSILRKSGGVRIGSPLAGELNAIGVTPKSAPGLFRKQGGRGAADNFVAREYEIFENLATDGNGYVLQDDIIEAIRREVSGDPIRTANEEATIANVEASVANSEEWLRSVGLPTNATVKQIRERMAEVLGQERLLDDVDMKIARLNSEIENFDKATDALRNEKIGSEAEAANVAAELRALEDEINASYDLARSSPSIKIMVDYAKARRDYGKARYEEARLKNRIDALKRVDADGLLTHELEMELNAATSDLTKVLARRDAALAKSDKLKPMLPKQKQEIPEFISDSDRAGYVDEVVTAVFNNLTGRGDGEFAEWMVPVKRGPLKERTFNIPDELVEEFLENDMEAIVRNYTRKMSAEVELTRRFGRADMKDQLEAIRTEYSELSKAAATPEERLKLDRAMKRDMTNLTAFRDMIRGTYRAGVEGSDWSKITRAALTWNYVRLLGGQLFASITDASRVIGVHGVRATMREGLPTLISNVRSVRISKADARALGAVTERVLQSRLATLAELTDPYSYGSKFERFLSNTSNVFTKATGIGWWNDTMKSMASVMTQNRMMRNAMNWAGAGDKERAYMAFLGINEDTASRIAAQFKKYGIEEDGIFGANVSMWDDEFAKRAWAAALNKDVDRTIITKGVADTPLWTKTNWGRLITQFKSFGLASHQRVLIAGLQERPHRFAEQMVMATAIGMLVTYLKFIERGDYEEAERLLSNPGLWVANGLDRSGILSIPFEISNTAEKLGYPGLITAAQMAAGDEDMGGSAARYASRGVAGSLGGPFIGTIEDLVTISNQLLNADLKKSGANAIIRQVPGATLPGIRSAIHIGVKPEFQEAVE